MNTAHAILSDASQRRQYDAARPHFGAPDTSSGQQHPYASSAYGRNAHSSRPDYGGQKFYGINEEVWLAHHYGPYTARKHSGMPPLRYGMHVAEERMREEEDARIRRYEISNKHELLK